MRISYSEPLYTERQEPLECPNCGKHALVQHSAHKYRCLWCGFDRDISTPEQIGFWPFVMLLIFGAWVMSALLTTANSSNPEPIPFSTDIPAHVSPNKDHEFN